MQSWSAPGETPFDSQAQAKQAADPKKTGAAKQQVLEGPTKEDIKAVDMATAPAPTPEISQEIKGLLGLAYPDLMAVATTACDAWIKGHTQVQRRHAWYSSNCLKNVHMHV